MVPQEGLKYPRLVKGFQSLTRQNPTRNCLGFLGANPSPAMRLTSLCPPPLKIQALGLNSRRIASRRWSFAIEAAGQSIASRLTGRLCSPVVPAARRVPGVAGQGRHGSCRALAPGEHLVRRRCRDRRRRQVDNPRNRDGEHPICQVGP